MFRCSDTTFVTFENRKFLFSRLTLFFALLVFSFQGASCFEGLILQNRTMNIFHNLALKNVYEKPFVRYSHEKPFVMLRITHVFASQTYLKSLCQPVLQAIHSDKSFYAAFLRFSP